MRYWQVLASCRSLCQCPLVVGIYGHGGAHRGRRRITHDAYMEMLSAVCRSLGIEGIDGLLPDRKAKGDFACYIARFLALEQR